MSEEIKINKNAESRLEYRNRLNKISGLVIVLNAILIGIETQTKFNRI